MAYKSNRRNAEARVINALVYGVDAADADIVQMAIPLANIQYGALRGSIQVIPAKVRRGEVLGGAGVKEDTLIEKANSLRGGAASVDVNYAIAQEFGPYGKPFMRPSMKRFGTAKNIAKHARGAYRW